MGGQQERRSNVVVLGGSGEEEGGRKSCEQISSSDHDHRIDIVDQTMSRHRMRKWIESVRNTAEERSTRSEAQPAPWPSIPEVPHLLQGGKDFEKIYEPRVVSIGPYHHGKPHLRQVQAIKPLCVKKLEEVCNRGIIDDMYEVIESNIRQVRKCYDERRTRVYNDEALAKMMLLDGCFVLLFILSKGQIRGLKEHENIFVQNDLFLLENQLPLGVLQLIISLTYGGSSSEMIDKIKEFIIEDIRIRWPVKGPIPTIGHQLEVENSAHLLDLLRSALLGANDIHGGGGGGGGGGAPASASASASASAGGDGDGISAGTSAAGGGGGAPASASAGGDGDGISAGTSAAGGGGGGGAPASASASASAGGDGDGISAGTSAAGGGGGAPASASAGGDGDGISAGTSAAAGGGGGGAAAAGTSTTASEIINWQFFRHVRELKASGIHFRPNIGTRDISFESHCLYGYLKLPVLIIDDFTKSKFLNMVAYEMCPDGSNGYAVTSFVCFLEELIDDADDVRELRSKKILYNCLGSDDEVARLFNKIGHGLVNFDAYNDVKYRIQKHFDKKVNTWIAQGLHDHFSSPWTILASIAAVLLLLFTGVQTGFAIGK